MSVYAGGQNKQRNKFGLQFYIRFILVLDKTYEVFGIFHRLANWRHLWSVYALFTATDIPARACSSVEQAIPRMSHSQPAAPRFIVIYSQFVQWNEFSFRFRRYLYSYLRPKWFTTTAEQGQNRSSCTQRRTEIAHAHTQCVAGQIFLLRVYNLIRDVFEYIGRFSDRTFADDTMSAYPTPFSHRVFAKGDTNCAQWITSW